MRGPSCNDPLASAERPSGPVRRRGPDASPRSGSEREAADDMRALRGGFPARRVTRSSGWARIAARG